jgi:aminoglycoside phosphotransferase (APT) family kinase protein
MLFDGRPEHFLVDEERVAGLIDLHDVQPGDAAMDLAVINLADPLLTAGVLAGYRPTSEELAVFRELVPFFTVLRALAAAEWHGNDGEAAALLARARDALRAGPVTGW